MNTGTIGFYFSAGGMGGSCAIVLTGVATGGAIEGKVYLKALEIRVWSLMSRIIFSLFVATSF